MTIGLLIPTICEGFPPETHLFRSGDGGYSRYRIPALLTAPDQSLLAFCEGRKDGGGLTGNIDLILRRSSDNGKTWGPIELVMDDGKNTLGNPCPLIDQSTGTIWLAFTRSLGSDRGVKGRKVPSQLDERRFDGSSLVGGMNGARCVKDDSRSEMREQLVGDLDKAARGVGRVSRSRGCTRRGRLAPVTR